MEPVVVLRAKSTTEAQIAEATLQAEGIEAFVQSPSSSLTPNVGVLGDDVPELEVLVPAESAEAARAILSSTSISEEELTAMEESDPQPGEEE